MMHHMPQPGLTTPAVACPVSASLGLRFSAGTTVAQVMIQARLPVLHEFEVALICERRDELVTLYADAGVAVRNLSLRPVSNRSELNA